MLPFALALIGLQFFDGSDVPIVAAVGSKTAVVVGPARHIASGVDQARVSTVGGRAMVLTSQLPRLRPGKVLPTEQTQLVESWLVAYDFRTGAEWRIRRAAFLDWRGAAWTPDGKSAYTIVTEMTDTGPQWQCLAVNAEARTVRTVASGGRGDSGGSSADFAGYDSLPIVWTEWGPHSIGQRVGVPKPDRSLQWFEWGGEADVHDASWVRTAAGHWAAFLPGTDVRFIFDPAAAQPVQVRGELKLSETPDRAPGIAARLRAHALSNQGTAAATQGLWIETDSDPPERVLVATDVLQHFVADDWTWIAYRRGDGLYVHDVELVDPELIRQARESAARTKSLMQAKQVGTAVQIFAVDHDERLPTRAEFEEAIKPYLKNDDLLKSFVYLLDGQNRNNIEDLAGTELGYVTIKGGRAVVYADGHAKIIYDKPPA